MTTKQTPIHIQLGYNESLQSKRAILSSEANLLRVLQTIRRYKPLRLQELSTKIKFKKKLKDTNAEIAKLQLSVPKVKIPEILKKTHPDYEEEVEHKISRAKSSVRGRHETTIEAQLQEIQDKLRSLK